MTIRVTTSIAMPPDGVMSNSNDLIVGIEYRNVQDSGFNANVALCDEPGLIELNVNHVSFGDFVDLMSDVDLPTGVELMIPVSAAQALIYLLNAAIDADAFRSPDETGLSAQDEAVGEAVESTVADEATQDDPMTEEDWDEWHRIMSGNF